MSWVLWGWDSSVSKGELYPLNDSRFWVGSSNLIQPRIQPCSGIKICRTMWWASVAWDIRDLPPKEVRFRLQPWWHSEWNCLQWCCKLPQNTHVFLEKVAKSYPKTCRIDPSSGLSELIARIVSIKSARNREKRLSAHSPTSLWRNETVACLPSLEALSSVRPSQFSGGSEDSSNQV